MEVAGEVTFALTPSCCNPDTDVKTAVCLKCHSWVTAKKPAPQEWTGQPDSRTPKASSSFNKLAFHPRKSHRRGVEGVPRMPFLLWENIPGSSYLCGGYKEERELNQSILVFWEGNH